VKCSNCSFENTKDSIFCQECGHDLSKTKNNGSEEHINNTHKSLHKEIEDVIFEPKKKSSNWGIWVFVICLVIFGFLVLIIIGQSSSSPNSNPSVAANNTSENAASYTLIENEELNWIGQDLYYIGTLKNTGSKAIKDVRVRIDFYYDKAATKLFDTRYATIVGAAANGAFSFQIQLPIYPPNQFWWRRTIESAGF